MTREEAKELLPIIQALAEGKSIQNKIEGLTGWVDTDEIYPEYDGQKVIYRIKPEPKFRAFKTQEECWEEMLKHQPFGWVKSKRTKINNLIESVSDEIYLNGNIVSYENAFRGSEFLNGTPFGIKE